MKFLYLLISSILLFSCQELPTRNQDVIEEIEKLDYTTFSINSYNPEFLQESEDSLLKVVRDSSKNTPKRNIFNGIVKRLGLDSTQNMVADSLLTNHRKCVESCISFIKIEEKNLIDSARIQIDLVRKDLDSGVITRQSARRLIQEINTTLKRKLLQLNDKFKVKNCMESCDREFIVEFSKILNPIQMKRFNDWLFMNKLPKRKMR